MMRMHERSGASGDEACGLLVVRALSDGETDRARKALRHGRSGRWRDFVGRLAFLSPTIWMYTVCRWWEIEEYGQLRAEPLRRKGAYGDS